MLPSVIGSIGWSKRGIRLVLIRRTRARRPCRNGLCFVGLQPANMVDNHLVVWLAWLDVEDSLGKRPVTLDGSQPYRERQVRSHEHGSDYVSRSGRRLLREGTGNGRGKGGQNNCPPDHLKASPRERLAFTALYHARARFSASPPLLELLSAAASSPLFGAVLASVPARHNRIDGSLSPQSPMCSMQPEVLASRFTDAAQWLVLAA